MLATQNVTATRHELLERVQDARQRTDELFALVKPEFLYDRPIAERHRIVFYIGHLEAFDWNLFHDRVFGVAAFHPEFDKLFAFGIDPVGGGLPSDQPTDWPSLAQVKEYVRKIRSVLDNKLENVLAAPQPSSADGFSLSTFLNVAIEHRLMHAETLAYMLHQLPLNKKVLQREGFINESSAVIARNIEIPSGRITRGLSRDRRTFGWDNEFETETVDVPAFAIDQYKVTNRQYLEFIAAGGYENPAFWADGQRDWEWKSERGISHPAFWLHDNNRWLYRTMFEDVPLPLDWPVYVSLAEARAFANWAGKSLPTEAQWQRAAYGAPGNSESLSEKRSLRDQPIADSNHGNFDFIRWSPIPVNAFPDNRSALGVEGMSGNGWEWTATEFAPLPGFEPFPFYRGYSADFFDGKHFVMKGGSARTAACMLRPTFRNWFQSHYQFVYTGFRCVSGRS